MHMHVQGCVVFRGVAHALTTSRSWCHAPASARCPPLLASLYQSKRLSAEIQPSRRALWERNSRTEKNSITVFMLRVICVAQARIECVGCTYLQGVHRMWTVSHLIRRRLLLCGVFRKLGHVVEDARIHQLGRACLALRLQHPTPRVVVLGLHKQMCHDHLSREQHSVYTASRCVYPLQANVYTH